MIIFLAINTGQFVAFPVRLLQIQHILFGIYLKKAKQRPEREGQPGGKFADPKFFFRKLGENIDATRSVKEGCAFSDF